MEYGAMGLLGTAIALLLTCCIIVLIRSIVDLVHSPRDYSWLERTVLIALGLSLLSILIFCVAVFLHFIFK